MRSTIIMLSILLFALFANQVGAQQLVSTVTVDKQLQHPKEQLILPLQDALNNLEKKYNIHIVYDDELVSGKVAPVLASASVSLQEALEATLAQTMVAYKQVGARSISLIPRVPEPVNVPLPAGGTIKGKVTDDNGEAVPLAQILIQGTTMGDAADQDGNYEISNIPPGNYTLVTRVIGYKTETAMVSVSTDETVNHDFALAIDILSMDEIVTVGTPGGVGQTKREASFAITTIEAAAIRQVAPKSTANLMEAVPGVWAESSGGVAGANIDVRGLPGGGDAPFVTMSINGAPLYGTEMLSFFEQSSIFRIDETVATAEALRGGPNAVFSNGEPGVTMNFTLKRGTEETQSRVKYSTSDYNLQRVDAIVSGKLSEGFYYMAGGYASTSPGVRETQFNAEKGQQFTAQLTKIFNKGTLNAFTRITDDHGQWILPMALNSGNDLGDFAQLGNATRFRELQVNAQGEMQTFDFSSGRGWDGSVSGINADFDMGNGWTVRDNLSYTSGQANTFGFVPNGGAIQVSALNMTDVQTQGDETLSGSDWVQNYGHWVVLKDLESFTNDISIAKTWNQHDITVGSYQASWTSGDFWTLGNHVPVHNVSNGDLLANVTAQDVADAGGGGPWAYGLQSAGDARVIALYAAESWQATSDLRVDLGVRRERIELEYTLDAGSGYPDGSRDMAVSLDDDQWAFTGAANYQFNSDLGAFARFSDGFVFPHFDDIRENNLNTNNVRQYELGLKYAPRQLFNLFATGYFSNYDAFESIVGGGFDARAFQTESMGIELDGGLFVGNLTVRAIATVQSTEITDSEDDAIIGNTVLRQPDWQFRLAPNYDIALGNDFSANIYGALRLVGKRYGDNENVNELDGFEKLDLGVTLSTPSGLSFNLHIDNLTDSDGLTEADPRTLAAPNGRPILGRSMRFSVGYDL